MLSLLLVLHLPAALGLAAAARHLARRDPRRRRRLRRRLLSGAARSRGVLDPPVHRPRPGGVLRAVRHQSHGLIEMHFHFFGALAFLLVYRDWRVIVAAAAFVAVHHLAFMVLQDAGAPVWVMSHAHLSFGMVAAARGLRRLRDDRARDRRALARVRDARRRRAARGGRRRARPAGAAGGRARAPRPDRARRPGDGAAAILRSGIGHVATLVETIQSAAVDITQTSQRGLRRLGRLRALQHRDRRRRRPASPTPPSVRPGS